jgi:hypothetical protein
MVSRGERRFRQASQGTTISPTSVLPLPNVTRTNRWSPRFAAIVGPQGGPESRVVTQARLVVPAFHVKTFMPHHLGVRANSVSAFSLEYGLHFPYDTNEQPLLRDFLKSSGVPQVAPVNYWDAWVFDANGVRAVANDQAKAQYGLPATGPGPGVQGENPRAGQLECAGD